MRNRYAVVNLMKSWIGKNEKDGSYKEIIDIYNNSALQQDLPRGLKMQYNWAWCACTWSAAAIKLGYTDIMPIEISCGNIIEKAREMGIWVETDSYIPSPGDGLLYDWDDSGIGDNRGWPDHIGVIESVNKSAGYMTVIEGNYNDSVKRRTISINGKYIRGFIVPKYDTSLCEPEEVKGNLPLTTIAREVIAGKWGSGATRKSQLTAAGYNYDEVQAEVNRILNGSAVTAKDPIQDQQQPVEKSVTSTCRAKSYLTSLNNEYRTLANLYCRNDAGTNKKALCQIPKGSKVRCYGYYTQVGDVKWLYIVFVMDGVKYTGFSSSTYLVKA